MKMPSGDYAVATISLFIEQLEKPAMGMTKEEFEERSYAIWAAEEMLNRVIENHSFVPPYASDKPPRAPLSVIAAFIEDMEFYCSDGGGKMFEVAKDTGEELAYRFL